MNWETVIALLLLAYAIGFYLVWTVLRDACGVIDTVQKPLDRYASMTRTPER